ncbi:MAG: hypothetical protein LCH63_14705 [Candidatus Melainabacteria bacterium]|nr:hypothetical protein [Candidatus Melainabacteria bacterium]OPZ91621.1 MAG: hypothetical protein BWY75_00234 [bacterium ADurb.Bin425]
MNQNRDQKINQSMAREIPQEIPRKISQKLPQKLPQRNPQNIPQKLPIGMGFDRAKFQFWNDFEPDLFRLADLFLLRLQFQTGLKNEALTAWLSERSDRNRHLFDLLVEKVLFPCPFLLARMFCESGFELHLVASRPGPCFEGGDDKRSLVVSADEMLTALRQIAVHYFGESPAFSSLAWLIARASGRLASFEYDLVYPASFLNDANPAQLSASQSLTALQTKLEAFWSGKEAISWNLYLALLNALEVKLSIIPQLLASCPE